MKKVKHNILKLKKYETIYHYPIGNAPYALRSKCRDY